jgi:putative oxidoreductase
VPRGYHQLGLPVRRFFSNFAGGWPAIGLLLIRIAAGAALTINGRERIYSGEDLGLLTLGVLSVADGVLLAAGLWTPLAGLCALALSVTDLLIYHEGACPAILLASMGVGVALVGPGAFSIDAWLFGLKRIDIEKLESPPRA